MANYDALFEPLQIKGVTIRNRFLSTSHCPSYARNGEITERYIRYHEEKAKGGVGLTQFGGATTVSPECSSYYGQVDGSHDGVIAGYRAVAAAVHAHGAKCTVQLTHGGRRERWDIANWLPTFAPSCMRETVHGSFPVVMEDHDLRRLPAEFADAARRVRDGGVDGVEVSCQGGTLIEQFWTPAMNTRQDEYGGSLENRMRFGLDVLRAIRAAVGPDFIVGMRMPGDQMLQGGLDADHCVTIAATYAASALIDFISVVGANASTHQGEAKIWPTMWVPSGGYLPLAQAVKAAVSIPIFHASRIADAATATHAVREGLLDMVGMTRSFIADPAFANKLRDGQEDRIRPCVGIGYCVDRVITGHDACCAHNVATGRELQIPQRVARSDKPSRKVVVVGGGPAGLEAARVCARRGHEVTLLEAATELGGQMVLAAKPTWRRGLSGITTWLGEEISRLGVDVRLGLLADAEDVLEVDPEVVVIATGGLPHVGDFTGACHAVSTWDILSSNRNPGEHVLLYDESGGHAGLSCAEHMASQGTGVRLVTPDLSPGRELGGTNLGAHLTEIYKHGVDIHPSCRIDSVEQVGNQLRVSVRNSYSGRIEEYDVDQVVGECATLPNDDLYMQLKPQSRNFGEVDLRALAAFEPQRLHGNPEADFYLYRIGDAWTSRNIHAATLDAMRICKDL